MRPALVFPVPLPSHSFKASGGRAGIAHGMHDIFVSEIILDEPLTVCRYATRRSFRNLAFRDNSAVKSKVNNVRL